eukprot:symbB.v1.2.024238.t1/scaffold2279.1/size83532/5
MFRFLAFVLASQCRHILADESWQDTPILTSLWQATSSKDNDAVDRRVVWEANGLTLMSPRRWQALR